MKLRPEEKETIMNFTEDRDDSWVQVYTYNKRMQKRLRDYAGTSPEQAELLREDGYGGMTWRVHKSAFSIRLSKPLSNEQREQYRRRGLEQAQKGNLTPRVQQGDLLEGEEDDENPFEN